MPNANTRSAAPDKMLETRPLSANLGVEVVGLDLSQSLGAETLDAIKRLWRRHLILLFRGQRLSEESQIAFTRNFGDLAVFTEADKRSTRNPEIVRIGNVDEDGAKRTVDNHISRYYAILTGLWHTDGSYKTVPSYASALHAIEVPPSGAQTCRANTEAAYAAMPEAMRRRIEGKHMVHDLEFTRQFAEGLPPRTDADRRAVPPVCHPVVRRHPDGRKSLYISANVAYYVGGMSFEEGKKLHAELVAWATQPQFVYCHSWMPGDLVMWDNRFTLHRVTPFDGAQHRRVMQRTELVGTEIPA
jgi:alpha-ketoglutarate-dependent taurine dioxygenase